MRIAFAAAVAAGLMASACGGGQTGHTDTEEALSGNGVQSTAPSPGTVDHPANGAAGANAPGNAH